MNRALKIDNLNVEVRDVMTDIEGWLENSVDVHIEGRFVGNLIELSTNSRTLKREITKYFDMAIKELKKQKL